MVHSNKRVRFLLEENKNDCHDNYIINRGEGKQRKVSRIHHHRRINEEQCLLDHRGACGSADTVHDFLSWSKNDNDNNEDQKQRNDNKTQQKKETSWLSLQDHDNIRKAASATAKRRRIQDQYWIEMNQSNRSFSHIYTRVYLDCHKKKEEKETVLADNGNSSSVSCRGYPTIDEEGSSDGKEEEEEEDDDGDGDGDGDGGGGDGDGDGDDDDSWCYLELPTRREHAATLQHHFVMTGCCVRGLEDSVTPRLGLQRRFEQRKYVQTVCSVHREQEHSTPCCTSCVRNSNDKNAAAAAVATRQQQTLRSVARSLSRPARSLARFLGAVDAIAVQMIMMSQPQEVPAVLLPAAAKSTLLPAPIITLPPPYVTLSPPYAMRDDQSSCEREPSQVVVVMTAVSG